MHLIAKLESSYFIFSLYAGRTETLDRQKNVSDGVNILIKYMIDVTKKW